MSKRSTNLISPDEQRAAFAGRLRSFTDERGMAGKIAEETNTSVQAVRRWAAGETEPSRDKLVAMANYLGVTLQWLIAGQQPKWNDPVPPSPETTKTQQDYLIVEAGDLQELQQLVRQHLDDGFEIEGGVFVFNVSHFGQTLKQRLEKM